MVCSNKGNRSGIGLVANELCRIGLCPVVRLGYWRYTFASQYCAWRQKMFAAMILAIAIVALFQFAMYYWRAVLTGTASLPVSNLVLEAAHVDETNMRGSDFRRLVSLYDLTPELKSGSRGLGLVSLYFMLVRNAEAILGKLSPAVMNWGERETALCARYAAVQIDRRLQANLAQAASIRSC